MARVSRAARGFKRPGAARVAAIGLVLGAAACGGDENRARDEAGSDADATGGSGGGAPADAEIVVTRQGDQISIEAPEEYRFTGCGVPVPMRADAANGALLRDERPPSNVHAGYFVGDEFVRPVCNLGCDGGGSPCLPLNTEVDVFEYVQVGERAVPDGHEQIYQACLIPGATDGGLPQAPVFERRSVEGDLVVRLYYYTDSSCRTGGQQVTMPVAAP